MKGVRAFLDTNVLVFDEVIPIQRYTIDKALFTVYNIVIIIIGESQTPGVTPE